MNRLSGSEQHARQCDEFLHCDFPFMSCFAFIVSVSALLRSTRVDDDFKTHPPEFSIYIGERTFPFGPR
jgi:hypothetical protein